MVLPPDHAPLKVADLPADSVMSKLAMPEAAPAEAEAEEAEEEEGSDLEDDSESCQLTERRKTCLGKLLLPVVESGWFGWMVLGAIVLNCVQLCEYFRLDPYTSEMADWLQTVDTVIEMLLWGVFSAELVLKLMALGVALYFADGWNCLDAAILGVGYLGFLPGLSNLSVFRVLRIVRPLRIVGKLHGMKVIMQTIQHSMKPLFDTILLSFLLFFVFGIVALQLFQGVMNRRCYNALGDNTYTLDTDTERLCGGEFECGASQECLISDSTPNYSLTSFNDIGKCFLTIFVAITLEGWTDVMYFVQVCSALHTYAMCRMLM